VIVSVVTAVVVGGGILLSGPALTGASQQNPRQALRSSVLQVDIAVQELQDAQKDEARRRAALNQKYATMLEAIRANKDLEAERAKKILPLIQQMQADSRQESDLVTSMLDVMLRINQNIFGFR
jgi:hypothetical protein